MEGFGVGTWDLDLSTRKLEWSDTTRSLFGIAHDAPSPVKILVGDDHIILAEGRDYADVSPIDGVILSSGEQEVDVGVDVIPIKSEDAPPTFG